MEKLCGGNTGGWPTFTFFVMVGATRSAVSSFRSCAFAEETPRKSIGWGEAENRDASSMSSHLYNERKGGPARVRSSKSILNVVAVLFVFAPMLLVSPSAWATPKYRVLHAFGQGQDGAGTWGSLILDRNGNLYGTTSGGGLRANGTVFELTPRANGKWHETILYSFKNDGVDGCVSTAGLTFDASGAIYGTSQRCGAYGYGTVFSLSPGSSGWTESVLHSFDLTDGARPYGGVVIAPGGNVYGTADIVFALAPGSDGWTESVIDDFSRHNDGNGPYAGLILDASGVLYGTTKYGGAHNAGIVYELKPTVDGSWKERILHSFCPAGFPCADGAVPGLGALAMDQAGNLYGTTIAGGANCGCGGCDSCGVIYKLTRGPHGHWTETALYNFKADSTGHGPGAGVVRDEAGNLYGTTIYGGSPQCSCGVVYKFSPSKNGKWTYTVLHRFVGSDGAQPDANLTLDNKGNLFGTTATGGAGGAGVVFEITP